MYLAVPQIAWAVGTITGPLIGGLFVEHATWQWVFYINFPFCAIGLAIISFTVKLFAERPSVKERLMRMDWVGMFLFITSTTSFLIGITWGGVQYEWYSWQTLVPLLLGLFGLYLTCMWEIFVAPNPFLRFSLFNNRSANAAYIGSLLQGLLVCRTPPNSHDLQALMELLYSCSAHSTTSPSTSKPSRDLGLLKPVWLSFQQLAPWFPSASSRARSCADSESSAGPSGLAGL
jgi:MFS family permease